MTAVTKLGFAAAAALALLAAPLEAAETRYAVEITASTLNVRSGVWGTILGRVHRNDRFVVNRSSSGWHQIDWKGRRAWISGRYARRVNAEMVEITARTRLNIRTGGSTRYRILGQIPRGHATVRLSSGSWSKIQFDAREAWAYSGYLRTIGTTPTPTPTPRPTPTPPTTNADRLLVDAMNRAVNSARRELAAGVRESGGANRGPRVDEYARNAGMGVGYAWCGFFYTWNATQAARELGRSFSGQRRLHSVEKSRCYFLYRHYTQSWTASRVAAWEAERARHRQQGSTRRWMALRGSGGHTYASARNLPVDVFDRYQDLPLRPGDMVLWPRHMAMVESYDAASGRLVTIDGNVSNRVIRRTHHLSNSSTRGAMMGFGRPAWGDFD